MNLITIARLIPPRTSAWWPLDSPFEGGLRERYPKMEGKVRILAHVETSGPALCAITAQDPNLYISGKAPALKTWQASDLLFDAVTLSMNLGGKLYFVVSNTLQNFSIQVVGKIRVESASE
jgi:hypothetical protein